MAEYQNTPGKSWIIASGVLKIILGFFLVVVMITYPNRPSVKLFGAIVYGIEIIIGILGCCFAGAQSTGKSLTLLILGGIQLFLYIFSALLSGLNFFGFIALALTIWFLLGAWRNFSASKEE